MNNVNRSGLAWVIGGLALGVTLGILFAPKSGKETRASMKENLTRLRDKYRASHASRQGLEVTS